MALSDGTTESLPHGKLDASKTSLTMVNSDPFYRALFVAFSAGASSLINGQCGSANGGTFPSAPSSNLCSAGTPSSVSGSGPWTWSCAGSNGGSTANCSANIQQTQTWTVTPSAGSNGSISPSTPQTVNNTATRSFTVTPAVGYSASVGGTCGGSPSSGTAQFTYTTNAITANCTVTVTFTAGVGFRGIFWQHQATGSLSAWMMNGTSLAALATVTPGVVSDLNWKIVGVK